MKILLYLSACFLLVLSGRAQTHADSIKLRQMYLAAYKYIARDSLNRGDTIFVVDSLVESETHRFIRFLDNYPKEKDIAQKAREEYQERIKMYNKRVINDTHPITYSPILATLFRDEKGSDANKILIFSRLINNMLTAELVARKRNMTITYKELNHLEFETLPDFKEEMPNVKNEYYEPIGSVSSRSYLWRFTESTKYLFLFNNHGKLINVFHQRIIYD